MDDLAVLERVNSEMGDCISMMQSELNAKKRDLGVAFAALDCIVRRLQMDVNDGSRPDQWSMEDLIRTAKAALPVGWVIGAA